MVNYWLTFAGKLVNAARWGNLTDDGIQLFAGHNLSLERKAMDASDNGATPGESVGVINNMSVDKVSVGYDSASAAELDAGHWNLTIYGTRFVRLARMMGSGGLQIGGGEGLAIGAWPGPWHSMFPNQSG
jgi:hypothetical protein